MGCFVLPKKNTKRMNDIQTDFWWGKHTNSKGIYIKSFDFLCKPIDQGGLGFKEDNKVNQAMISRISWRLVSNPDNLWDQILKRKYFKKQELFNPKRNQQLVRFGNAFYKVLSISKSIVFGM